MTCGPKVCNRSAKASSADKLMRYRDEGKVWAAHRETVA